MAKSDTLTLRINPLLKNQGNNLLEQLGLTPSAFVSMAYSQLVHRREVPFRVALADEPDINMTQTEFDELIAQGDRDIQSGNYKPADQVFAELDKKLVSPHQGRDRTLI